MIVLTLLLVLVSGVLAIAHIGQLASLVIAASDLRRRRRASAVLRDAAAGSGALPGVSALLLGSGEALSVSRAIEVLREQQHPDLEIIVVLDGASGAVLDALCERFDLRPADPRPRGQAPTEHVRAVFVSRADERLIVVDKRGRDRADGWNAALNLATRPLVLPLDSTDTLAPHALAEATLPFALDPTLTAASVTVRIIGSGGRVQSDANTALVSALSELQAMRQALGGLALASLDAYAGAASAVTVFVRSALVRAGGFQPRSPEPDREVVFRLHAAHGASGPARIARAADAVVWRPAPVGWSALAGADTRRAYGSALWLRVYGAALTDRRFGALARLAIPYAWLELALPIAEAAGWLLLILGLLTGSLALDTVLLFLSCTIGLGVAVSLAALLVDLVGFEPVPDPSETLQRVGVSVLEQLGPRQVALWWRVRGLLHSHRIALAS